MARPLQHIGAWSLVWGVHAWALVWWLEHHSQVQPKTEVSWIQWVTQAPVPAPKQVAIPPASRSITPKPAAAPPVAPSGAPLQTPSPAVTSPLASTADPSFVASNASAPAATSMPASSSTAVSLSPPDGRGAQEVTLPSQNAAYLNNPKPTYPPISMRMGEQGRVIVRVLIDDKGLPQQAQLEASSGHVRLDQAALTAVMSWRFVPGRKGGKPQTMWFSVPITFDLKPAQDG